MPFRSIHPPSEISRFLINIGLPGAQVICSTGLFRSSHALADIGFFIFCLWERSGFRAFMLACWPHLPRRREDIGMHWHIGVEIIDGHAGAQ